MGRGEISLILPIKKESKESIKTTLDSLEEIYRRNRFGKLYIVHPADDEVSRRNLSKLLREARYSYPIKIVVSPNIDKLKATDINYVLNNYVDDDITGVFDADNYIDKEILSKILEAFNRGYVAVSPRVYRYRSSFIGRLIFVESIIWYDIWISIFQRLNLHTPLSGEGLFIKTEVIKKLGGFPEELAEDAALSVILALNNLRYGYVDSYVIELAPKNLRALIKQRIRWYRGHLRVLFKLIRLGLMRRSLSKVLSTYIILFTPTMIYLAPIGYEIYRILPSMNEVNSIVRTVENDILEVMFLLSSPTQLLKINDLSKIFLIVAFYSYILMLGIISYQLITRHRRVLGLREILKILVIGIVGLPIYWFIVLIAFLLSLKPQKTIWYRTERR